jgi:hypothetical protein
MGTARASRVHCAFTSPPDPDAAETGGWGCAGARCSRPRTPPSSAPASILLHRLAADYVRATPTADVRDLSRHLATVVPDAHAEGPDVETSPAPVGEPLPAGDTAGAGDLANADLNDLDPHGEIQATSALGRC